MLADAGGIGYGEYLQVFTKKTNTTNIVTNYAVQLNQKRVRPRVLFICFQKNITEAIFL